MHSWEGDPRPAPTPQLGAVPPRSSQPFDQSIDPQAGSWSVLFAVAVGILLAVLFVTGNARSTWERISRFLPGSANAETTPQAPLSEQEMENLEGPAQQQAEILLRRAIDHSAGAKGQIDAHVEEWSGKIRLTPQLNALITTALNSDDLRLRGAAIQVNLAALGTGKSPATVERLSQRAKSSVQSQRIWALWELGLLGNRGVEPERVAKILTSQLHDPDVEVRRWAVEGLAYLGTDEAIAPLLQVFHDDSSSLVRERAACSLAQSGMFTPAQRRSAIPRFLDYADDVSLDAQTHSWVYQALRDITGQNLPNNSSVWRNWYSSNIS